MILLNYYVDNDSVVIYFSALDREQAAQHIIMFLWTKMVSVLMHCKPWLIIFATRKLHWRCSLNLHKLYHFTRVDLFIILMSSCWQLCPVHSFSLYRWALIQLYKLFYRLHELFVHQSNLSWFSCIFFCIKFVLLVFVTVPPAYYAHLGAFRARYYIEDDNSDQGSSTGATQTFDQSVPVKQLPKVKEYVQQFMFYC